jgi:hypothetical protein
MGIVVFDVDAFRAQYPEFSNVTDDQLQACFNQATLYLNNTECSVVVDLNQRAILLNMLTAHIAYMRYGDSKGNGGISGGVGRVSSASEGSVSVSFDMPTTQNNAWYMQSPYGSDYWFATAQFRTMRYKNGYSPSNYPNYYTPYGRSR